VRISKDKRSYGDRSTIPLYQQPENKAGGMVGRSSVEDDLGRLVVRKQWQRRNTMFVKMIQTTKNGIEKGRPGEQITRGEQVGVEKTIRES